MYPLPRVPSPVSLPPPTRPSPTNTKVIHSHGCPGPVRMAARLRLNNPANLLYVSRGTKFEFVPTALHLVILLRDHPRRRPNWHRTTTTARPTGASRCRFLPWGECCQQASSACQMSKINHSHGGRWGGLSLGAVTRLPAWGCPELKSGPIYRPPRTSTTPSPPAHLPTQRPEARGQRTEKGEPVTEHREPVSAPAPATSIRPAIPNLAAGVPGVRVYLDCFVRLMNYLFRRSVRAGHLCSVKPYEGGWRFTPPFPTCRAHIGRGSATFTSDCCVRARRQGTREPMVPGTPRTDSPSSQAYEVRTRSGRIRPCVNVMELASTLPPGHVDTDRQRPWLGAGRYKVAVAQTARFRNMVRTTHGHRIVFEPDRQSPRGDLTMFTSFGHRASAAPAAPLA